MSTQKHRALQALADANGRPFLAAAPLMAIVEAVAVLDDAGLLGRESDATLRSDIRAAIDNDEYDDNGEVVEAIRALLDAADPIDPDVPIPYRLAEPNMVGAAVEESAPAEAWIECAAPGCKSRALFPANDGWRVNDAGWWCPDHLPECPACDRPMRGASCMNPACPNAILPL